jgi:hypothetical protein
MWSYVNLGLAVLAGVSAGYVMLLANYWLQSVFGIAGLDFAELGLLLGGSQLADSWTIGFVFHAIDSALLGALYALAVFPLAMRVGGATSPIIVGVVGGLVFGIGVWLILAMLVAAPLLGVGPFGSKGQNPTPAILTLALHLLFGAILGFIYLP